MIVSIPILLEQKFTLRGDTDHFIGKSNAIGKGGLLMYWNVIVLVIALIGLLVQVGQAVIALSQLRQGRRSGASSTLPCGSSAAGYMRTGTRDDIAGTPDSQTGGTQ
ncbi:hypothetical protein [Nocardia bovistercoris]|uniref:hypothetical protein n=1 Tax=Nocardia bovistercoris TaxID=2785916 RepID=UPI001E579414|nr:hypothetical protein [Nocardia bovistercoris]